MSKKHLHRRAPGLNMVAIGMIAGLLIWAKLRLVTDFPRIVQADPEERAVETPDADEGGLEPTESGRQVRQSDLDD